MIPISNCFQGIQPYEVPRDVKPNLIMADARIINDIVPEDRWAFDVLNDEGEAKLREVVTAVKSMAANL